MSNRKALAQMFLVQAGWADAPRETVAGDASNRKYDRLKDPGTGETVILMDAPPEKGEDIRPFVDIAQHLSALSLSPPRILHADPDNGFLLLEDLGDALFSRVLKDQPDLEHDLYTAATDVLVHLHRHEVPSVDPYESRVMTELSLLAFSKYANAITPVRETTLRTFSETFQRLLAPLEQTPSVLILRDYHADNLLWLPSRQGVKRVGLLDFQDARAGHASYDLVSLLQDVRRDVSPQTEQSMIAHYIDQTRADADAFDQAYHLMGAQRALRILGVFARLSLEYNKPSYVDMIPKTWQMLERNLAHDALAPVAGLLRDALPYPSADVCKALRPQ